MLDDGETLVPGLPPGARAARVGRRAPAVPGREGRTSTDSRDVSRTHALLDHRERDGVDGFLTITGGKLTTFRLMAQHIVDTMCEQLGEERPCTTADDRAARLRGRPLYAPRRPPGRARGRRCSRRAGDLRVRAGRRARRLEEAMRRARHDEPRRHPPPAAPRHGPVPGRLLHLPRDRHPARRRGARRRAGDAARCTTSCRSAGRACGRSSTATSCARRAWTTGSSRACSTWSTCPDGRRDEPPRRRRRRRRASPGSTAAIRWPRRGARVIVLAKGVGATHLAPGTIDVLGYAPERVERPARGAGAALAAGPPVRAIGATRVGRGVAWLRERSPTGRCGYAQGGLTRTCCCRPRSARRSRRRVVPETMAGGRPARPARASWSSGFRALKDFYPTCSPTTCARAGASRRARVELDARARAAAPTRTRSASRGRSTTPASAARWSPSSRALTAPASASRFPASSGWRTRTAVWRDLAGQARPRPSSRCRRCRRRCRACAFRDAARRAARARAGGSSSRVGRRCRARERPRTGVRVRRASASACYAARWFVLATGGFASGGHRARLRLGARETAFGLPVAHLPEPGAPRSRRATSTTSRWRAPGVAVDARCARRRGRRCREPLVGGATLGRRRALAREVRRRDQRRHRLRASETILTKRPSRSA